MLLTLLACSTCPQWHWTGGGHATLRLSGTPDGVADARWTTPGVDQTRIDAYEANPEHHALPNGDVVSDPAAQAFAAGDPGAVLGWKRDDGMTEGFVFRALFYVYDDADPVVVCDHWIDWIVVQRATGGMDTGEPSPPPVRITFVAGGEDPILDGWVEPGTSLPEYDEASGRAEGTVTFQTYNDCGTGWLFTDLELAWELDPDVHGRTEACPGGWFTF